MGRSAPTTFSGSAKHVFGANTSACWDEEDRAFRRIFEFRARWQTGDPKHLISLPPVENFGKKRAVLPTSDRAFGLDPDKGSQIKAKVPLDNDSLLAANIDDCGGFSIGKHGTTGTKRGRRPKGATSLPFIRERIQEKLGSYPLGRVAIILRLKRRDQAKQQIYDLFAGVAVELIDARVRPVNRKAFSEAMGCHRKTVDRLYSHGVIQMSQKAPQGGKGKNMPQAAVSKLDETHALVGRIALVQTMHGEALDIIRETVQGLAERQDVARPWLDLEGEPEAA